MEEKKTTPEKTEQKTEKVIQEEPADEYEQKTEKVIQEEPADKYEQVLTNLSSKLDKVISLLAAQESKPKEKTTEEEPKAEEMESVDEIQKLLDL